MELYDSHQIGILRNALDAKIKEIGAHELVDYRGITYNPHFDPHELQVNFVYRKHKHNLALSTFLKLFKTLYDIDVRVGAVRITNNWSRYTFHTDKGGLYTEDGTMLDDEGWIYQIARNKSYFPIKMRFRIREV